jgi:hypothetical protein
MTLTPTSNGRRGGQTKVSLPRLKRFIQLVSSGLTLGQSAKGIGIGDQTRRDWMRRGQLELVRISDDGHDPFDDLDTSERGWPTEQTWTQIPPDFDPYEWPFVVFAVAVEKALAEFEARNVAIIQRAASGAPAQDGRPAVEPTWTAAAWLLERRFPELYGRSEARIKQAMEVTLRPAGTSGDAAPLTVDDLEASLREMEAVEAERSRQS